MIYWFIGMILAVLLSCLARLYICNKSIKIDLEIAEKRADMAETQLSLDRKITRIKIESLEQDVSYFQKQKEMLERLVSGYKIELNRRKIAFPDGTVEAVKYAMKHSHPDNGGNAEDFMKFKKCYEELTGK